MDGFDKILEKSTSQLDLIAFQKNSSLKKIK